MDASPEPLKVAVLVPHMRQVEAAFAASLAGLMQTTALRQPGWQVRLIMGSSSILPQSRTRLALEAMQWGADWLLWLDSDMIFPPEALVHLVSLGKDVVGANYARRAILPLPTAHRGDKLVVTTKDKAVRRRLEEVDSLGLGVCLVSGAVMKALHPPYFMHLPTIDALDFGGEDRFHFARIREAGFRVYVDHRLSGSVGHLHEYTLSFVDAAEAASRTPDEIAPDPSGDLEPPQQVAEADER